MTEENATTETKEAQTGEGTQTEENNNGNKNQEFAAKRLAEDKKKKDARVKELEVELDGLKNGKKETKEAETKNPGDIRSIIREELKIEAESESKIKEVLTEYPELKDHESKIRTYLKDDSRKNVPIEEVISGAIGFKNLLSLGAKIGAERLVIASESETGGGNTQIKVKTEAEKQSDKWMNSLPDDYK